MVPWNSPRFDNHVEVCAFADVRSGLRAIVAIHDLTLGPAVGGTRFYPYSSNDLALDDVLRLSRAMSYKCALAGLPLGGGKAVIIGDPNKTKTVLLLQTYGEFLNRIGAQFSTGEDVGMSMEDCEIIRQVSPYVAGTQSSGAGNPAIHTASGVLYGLPAVLRAVLNREDFAGVHFAIQGLGNVGWQLCRMLYQAGSQLSVSDLSWDRMQEARTLLGATLVSPERIHAADVDIFVPCAMGGIINKETVKSIRAKAVAGAANNQIESREVGEELQRRGILFAPDYVINAGGIIGAAAELARIPGRKFLVQGLVETRLKRIQERLDAIFEAAKMNRMTPEATAEKMAQEIISRSGSNSDDRKSIDFRVNEEKSFGS
jgi:leucine dehydrogenase